MARAVVQSKGESPAGGDCLSGGAPQCSVGVRRRRTEAELQRGRGNLAWCRVKSVHIRGIRGATSVESNTGQAILAATRELLARMASDNNVEPDELAAVLFTCTSDLTAAFPAEAARQLSWHSVPLMSATEMAVPEGLPMCIRVLMLWNSARSQEEVVHVYLNRAESLRPDLKTRQRGNAVTR